MRQPGARDTDERKGKEKKGGKKSDRMNVRERKACPLGLAECGKASPALCGAAECLQE